MAGKAQTWELGQAIQPWMVQKVILPLVDRGYLSFTDLGLDAETQKWVRAAGRDDQAKLISNALQEGWMHGWSGQAEGKTEADLAKLAKRMREGEAGPQAIDPSNLANPMVTHTRVMAAIQKFQQDNGIRQFDNDPNFKVGGGRVGLRTLSALNPQAPTLDVQQLQSEKQKVADRVQYAVTANPQTAANLAQMKFFYNWVPATTLASLAYEGYTVNDQFTQGVARLALNDRANPFWEKNQDRLSNLDHAPTLADINPRAFQVDRETGSVMAKPFAPANQAGALASSGGGILDALGPIGDAVKGAARWTDATLSAPMEFLQGAGRDIAAGVANAPAGVQALQSGGLNDAIHPNIATAGSSSPAPSALTTQGYVDPAAQTRLGLALSNVVHGQDAGMGSGFFAQGQVADEQAANARAALSVYGHAATPGRLLAAGANEALSPMGINIVEPGSVGYNVLSGLTDLGVNTVADPSNIALEGYANARRGASVISATEHASGLEKTGLIPAIRRTFNPTTATQWLDSPGGRKAVQWAADNQDFDAILRQVKDVPTALRLKDAATPEDAKNVLLDVLGTTIRDRVSAPPAGMDAVLHPFSWAGYEFRNYTDPVRILGNVKPGAYIDVHNPNQAVQQIDRTLSNVTTAFHQVDRTVEFNGVRMPATEAMARASEQGRPAMLDVARKVMGNIEDGLIARGVDPQDAKGLTRLFDQQEQMRGYLADEVARHADPGWARINGVNEPMPTPVALVDLLQNSISLPNARELKRLTSWVGKVPGLKGGVPQSVADSIYNGIFKPFALLRPATTLRVIAEEQLRIAADGYVSFTNHPIRALAMALGAPVRPSEAGLASKGGTLAGGLMDDSFAYSALENAIAGGDPVEFQKAMNGGLAHILNDAPMSRRYAGKVDIPRLAQGGADELHPDYLDAWGERLFHYTQDPVWRYAAGHTPQETKDWFTHGDGRQYLDYLRGSTTRAPGEIPLKPAGFDLNNIDDANHFIDQTYGMISQLTGQDTDIAHALIAKNKILDETGDEVDLFRLKGKGRKPMGLTPEAKAVLEAKANQAVGPDLVWGDLHKVDQSKKSIYDDAIRTFFSALYERPTNRLSRSPYFRQRYWERVEELVPYTDQQTAQQIVARAEAQGMFSETRADRMAHALHGEPGQPLSLESMRSQAALAGSTDKNLTMKEIDQLAKGHALDKTKNLLYDLTERSQFFDSMRLLFPFGEAWKEVATRWAGLVAQNPRVIRRFDQVVTEGKRSGFFYTDPTSGEEVFNYPGSQLFNKTLTGVDVPIVSQLNGLNIVGNGMPGVGWGVQIPMQFIMHTMPSVDDSPIGNLYRNYVAPFGDVSGGDPIGVAVSAALPPWIDRVREALGDPSVARQHANTIANIERYLISTGKYGSPGKGLSEAQMRKVREDASSAATVLTFVRAAGSFALPAAPNFQWQVVDKGGKLALTGALANELRGLYDQEKQGTIQNADAEFVKRHGTDLYGLMGSLSNSMSTGLPVTEKGADWVRSNQGIRSKYPAVYGLFAPPDPNGQFDQRLYEDQITRGERKAIDNSTWLRMANDRVANLIYSEQADRVHQAFPDGRVPSDVRAKMSQLRRQLVDQYPGFGEDFTDPGKRDFTNTVKQLRAAANDDALKNTQQARAIRTYLEARDRVSQAYAAQSSTGNPDGWVTANSWSDVRIRMAALQAQLRKRYPQAAPVFDLVFRKDGEA